MEKETGSKTALVARERQPQAFAEPAGFADSKDAFREASLLRVAKQSRSRHARTDAQVALMRTARRLMMSSAYGAGLLGSAARGRRAAKAWLIGVLGAGRCDGDIHGGQRAHLHGGFVATAMHRGVGW